MDQTEGEIRPTETHMSKEMQALMEKTHEALKQKCANEKQEAQTVYEIAIPAQTLTIIGKEDATYTINHLKALKLQGTYRITKR
ncbi:hypothetical protein [Olsenella sp. Marseille-P4559]|uniref:hypothetical protein n=1 Tax=Olsenella sp. Marseille-P4559 TaxID=2364795 RepID=UPI001031F6F0|nr:hypothetical protein [Olsenella sp. Marseille-P4559]